MRRTWALAMVLFTFVALLPGIAPVAAHDLEGDLAEVKDRIDATAARIEASEAAQTDVAASIVASRDNLNELLAGLGRLEAELLVVTTDLEDRQLHLDQVRDQLRAHYDAIAYTRQQLVTTRASTVELTKEMYMNAGASIPDVVFTAEAISDVVLTLTYLDLIASRDEASIARLEALESQEVRQQALIEEQEIEVELQVAELQTAQAELDVLVAELEAQHTQIEAVIAEQSSLLAGLEAEEQFFREELDGLEAEQAEIEQLIAERQSEGGSAPGILVRPVPGPITSGFGYRLHPILGYQRLHTGVDMRASYGTPIVSGADGVVIYSGARGGYGNTVMVDHGGGMVTLYAHQSSIAVANGQSVAAGQLVGYVGSTGLSTGPHLHFEVRINGAPVDPAPYL